ncbi:MAG: 4Fe-4S dicluster domain-containing protein [Pseudomonadota bacterium]
MQIGFYFDQMRCTGCYACSIACRDWHDIQDGSVHWRKIVPCERGTYPGVYLSYVSLSCNHCEHPACAKACPAEAIAKREQDGIMVVDRQQCRGGEQCGLCKEACPYGIPQFSREQDNKMQMCTFCIDRLAEGKKPVCVDACPMRALDAGPMDGLRKHYGASNQADGFTYAAETNPSIIIKPRY